MPRGRSPGGAAAGAIDCDGVTVAAPVTVPEKCLSCLLFIRSCVLWVVLLLVGAQATPVATVSVPLAMSALLAVKMRRL